MYTCRMQAPADRPRGLGRAGFTLIEVMVSVVIAGLLAGVIFQLMNSQASFVGLQSARQEVQQNTRGTLELISSELRAVPPGAITTASADRIEFYLPRVWGVTCQDMTGGGTVWVLFPAGTFPADFPAVPGDDWKLALPVETSPGSWKLANVDGATAGSPSCPDYDLSNVANVDAMNISFNNAGSAVRQEGTRVFLGQRITYESGTGASSSRIWVKRNNGAGSPQVMAGPLTGSGGLVFDYWCKGTKIAPPGTSTSGFPNLTAVQAKVAMASTATTTAGRQIQTDSTRVALRNATGGGVC